MATAAPETNGTVIKYDNQIPLDTVEKLYLDSETADVHFVFGSNDDSPRRVPAHKNLLAGASDVFKAMFYGKLKEKGDVPVNDVSVAAFEEFLKCFYFGKTIMSMENITDVMCLADKYNVQKCVELCVKFLKTTLTVDNMCFGLGLAILYCQKELKQHCEWRITLDTEAVFKSNSFLESNQQVLAHILKIAPLSCTEVVVFEACMSWLRANSNQEVLSKEIVQAHLGDIFYDIRFGSVTMEEFAELITSYGDLFSVSEYRDIIRMIVLPSGTEPTIFNKNPRERQWKTDSVIKCDRRAQNNARFWYELKKEESVTFSTNEPILLGSFTCAGVSIYRNGFWDSEVDLAMNVTISEKPDQTGSDKGAAKILTQFKTTLQSKLVKVIPLPSPVIIQPGFLYEICLMLLPEGHYYELRNLSTKVEIKPGITIQFHNVEFRNNESIGFVIALDFNR